MIFRDVLYTVLVVAVLLPSNPLGMMLIVKILIVVFAIASRIWRHVVYYKRTGKIY